MKRSSQLLITVGILLLISLVVSLFIFRNDLRTHMAESQMRNAFQQINTAPFDQLIFSPQWEVIIKQQREYKVKVEDADAKYTFDEQNKLLILTIDSAYQGEKPRVFIDAPSLTRIQASGNTHVLLKNFKTDALQVSLRDSATFKGSENEIEKLTIETEGQTKVTLIDDPMK